MNTELIIAKYFMPQRLRHIKITPEDEKMFIEHTSKGLHKNKIKKSHFSDGFNALREGKRWAGINIHELWEPGILDGSVPYFTLLGGEDGDILPREIVDFVKKEIFRGKDADIIEEAYQDILQDKL